MESRDQWCPHHSRCNLASSHLFSKLEAGEGSPAIVPDADIDPPFVELPELPDENEDGNDPVDPDPKVTTRSGRVVTMPRRFDAYEVSNTMNDYKIELTDAEHKYYSMMELCAQHIDLDHVEHGMVGAGIGGGFINTAELHVVTYDQALAS
jgi:hypothetical protein